MAVARSMQFLREDVVELEYSKNGVSLLCNEWSNVGCLCSSLLLFFIFIQGLVCDNCCLALSKGLRMSIL